jgi:cold shock CspA family protein
MLWFNVDKGHGYIRTEHDERLFVARSDFLLDHEPERRCRGRPVSFDRWASGGDVRAVNVAFITRTDPRRARLRHGRRAL